MWARLSAFVIWGLVAAALVYWALRLFTSAPAAPAHTVAVASSVAARGDLTRLLGAPPVAALAAAAADPQLSSRFQLLGVMAPKPGKGDDQGHGVALIAVDGKPAKAFVVGAPLDSELVLQAVSLRSASIGPAQGEAALKLEIPPLPAPATGTLPPPGTPGAAVAPAPVSRVIPPPAPPPPPMPQAVPQIVPQAQTPLVQDGTIASPALVPSPPNGILPRREPGNLNR